MTWAIKFHLYLSRLRSCFPWLHSQNSPYLLTSRPVMKTRPKILMSPVQLYCRFSSLEKRANNSRKISVNFSNTNCHIIYVEIYRKQNISLIYQRLLVTKFCCAELSLKPGMMRLLLNSFFKPIILKLPFFKLAFCIWFTCTSISIPTVRLK